MNLLTRIYNPIVELFGVPLDHTLLVNNEKQINNTSEALSEIFSYFSYNLGFKFESALILALDDENRLNSVQVVSQRSEAKVSFDDLKLEQELRKDGVNSYYMAHNHPSNVCFPSNEDIETTKKWLKKSKEIGVNLIDHLIISPKYYYSFKEANKLNLNP